jgi:hypothetical protein
MRDNMQNSGVENNPGENPVGERILEGTPVYDASGVSVGQVSNRGFEAGGLSVRRNGLIPRTVTIPTSAVRRSDANGVILSITKQQLDAMDRQPATEQPPAERVPSPQQPRATDAGEMPPDLDVAMPPGVEANPDPTTSAAGESNGTPPAP